MSMRSYPIREIGFILREKDLKNLKKFYIKDDEDMEDLTIVDDEDLEEEM